MSRPSIPDVMRRVARDAPAGSALSRYRGAMPTYQGAAGTVAAWRCAERESDAVMTAAEDATLGSGDQ